MVSFYLYRLFTKSQKSSRDLPPSLLPLVFCRSCPVYCAVLERPLQELREELQTDVTEALASYRKHSCSTLASAGQVICKNFKTLKLHLIINYLNFHIEIFVFSTFRVESVL